MPCRCEVANADSGESSALWRAERNGLYADVQRNGATFDYLAFKPPTCAVLYLIPTSLGTSDPSVFELTALSPRAVSYSLLMG